MEKDVPLQEICGLDKSLWARDVNKARGVKAKAKARDMQDQGQGHRPRSNAENAKVIFPVNAKVNPVFQFRVIFVAIK